jgi:hypothetical protein
MSGARPWAAAADAGDRLGEPGDRFNASKIITDVRSVGGAWRVPLRVMLSTLACVLNLSLHVTRLACEPPARDAASM